MKTFGIVTLFLFVFLFVLQCFVLDYFVIFQGGIKYCAVPILDGALLLYILFSYNLEYAATTGGVIWLLYSWLLLVKIIYFYFFVLGAPTPPESDEEAIIGLVGINISLYFTPILYSILSFRSTVQLYSPSKHSISIMMMLHADMVVHVMLDLLDLMVAFNYATLPDSVATDRGWLKLFIGSFISIAVFMHSYSFPTSAGSDKHQSDIFLTRKHAALVAMFIVDLPLLFVRLYLWIQHPNNPGFDSFLVKNITFLPLQAYRLNQCRLAEREKALSTQKNYFEEESATHVPEHFPERNSVALPSSPQPISAHLQKHKHSVPSHPPGSAAGGRDASGLWRSNSTSHSPAAGPRRRRLASVSPLHTHSSPSGQKLTVPEGDSHRKWKMLSPFQSVKSLSGAWRGGGGRQSSILGVGNHHGVEVISESLSAGEGLEESTPQHSPAKKGRGGETSRGGPVVPRLSPPEEMSEDELTFAADEAARATAAQLAGGLTDELDEGASPKKLKKIQEILNDLKSVREVPVRGFKITKVLRQIASALRIGGCHGLASMLDENFVLSYWRQIRLAFPILIAWGTQIALIVIGAKAESSSHEAFRLSEVVSFKLIPLDIFVSWCLAAGGIIAMIVVWIGSAPFLDALFVSIFWGVRLTSWYTTFHIVRDTRALRTAEWGIGNIQWIAVTILFAVKPVIFLINSLFALHSAFLGREHMYFIVKGANRKLPAVDGHEDPLDESKNPRFDQSGWVTTSSALVFNNVRHYLAPISFGELLIGPDLIKDIRLIDHLVLRSWLELLFTFFLKLASVALCFDWPYCALFGVHILLMAIYTTFGQAVRLLALRRYEIKALLEDIIRAWNDFERRAASDGLLDGDFAPQITGPDEKTRLLRSGTSRRFVTVNDLMDKYNRQGLFTSPGDILPVAL